MAALTLGVFALAAVFGERSLNAVVAPGVVTLAAAVVAVGRAAPPTITRTAPDRGQPGDREATELRVRGSTAGVYTLRDAVPEGIRASSTEHRVAGDAATVAVQFWYDRRGVHEVGPIEVEITDVLGLAARTVTVEDATTTAVVYPQLTTPSPGVLGALDALAEQRRHAGREEFDRLREYDRGDALRDVHWKKSADRPVGDLVVTEFHRESPSEGVRIGVGCRGSRRTVDAAATAAASVAVHLLDQGVEVGLETPTTSVDPGTGPEHRRRVLFALAELASGALPADREVPVRITAADGEASVAVQGRRVPFEAATDAGGSRSRTAGPDAGSGVVP